MEAVNVEEFIGQLQSAIGRARCDLVVAAMAIRGAQTELKGAADFMRLFAAAELIDKTQGELTALAAEIAKKKDGSAMMPFEKRFGDIAVELGKELYQSRGINEKFKETLTTLSEGTHAWKIACALQQAYDLANQETIGAVLT